MKNILIIVFTLLSLNIACKSGGEKHTMKSNISMKDTNQIKLVTVDPGHFHAALVQKKMYEGVSHDVHVYAPEGPDCKMHLERIKSYNSRQDNPTSWNEIVYTGPDFFEKMLEDKAGNVVVLAGNNMKKAEYITKSVDAGMNVLSDKPMIITPEDFPLLKKAFNISGENGTLIYDIMTERYEITTILQKLLAHSQEIFGSLKSGNKEEPSVTKVSVHHFSKMVSGKQLQRPAWYFDVNQQGEGIVDVTTHLVDLVQWECFPEVVLDTADITIIEAKRWPTIISKDEFKKVTGYDDFPDYLDKDIKNGKLLVYANGEIIYKIKDITAKVSVEWRYKAPQGGGDTHYSVMHGTKCDIVIKQGKEENFVPTLYVENIQDKNIKGFATTLKNVLETSPYDSINVIAINNNSLRIDIPKKYRVGHEEHFTQVTSKFLEYLKEGKMPEWEINSMITKYYTTTSALNKARGN